MKTLIVIFLLFAISTNVFSQVVEISTYVVDEVFNNREVVIHRRQPVLSWDYSGTISSFTVKVGTEKAILPPDEYVLDTSTVWVIHTTTSSANVSFLVLDVGKFRASIKYAGELLNLNTTYYWSLTVYDLSGSSTSKLGEFYTVASSVTVNFDASYDLQVDWNNPFNPYIGQVTKFRYNLKGVTHTEKKVKVRIYTLSGEYVTTAKHNAPLSDDPNWYKALPGREYTAEWDGTDHNSEKVEPGIYLANLSVEGETKGVTRIVIVNKK